MNFDFNAKEQAFFDEIKKEIEQYAEGRNLEQGPPEQIRQNIVDALALLKNTPYLKFGIEKINEMGEMIPLLKAMETIAGVSPSLLLSLETSTRLFGRILSAWGSEKQKSMCLTQLLDGKLIGAVALSEDTMNVENDDLQTHGVSDGNTIIVNGRKNYVVNGPIADWIAVVGKIADDQAIFLVEKGTEGLIMEDRLSTLGYEGAAISSLCLDNCRIPSDHVIQLSANKKTLSVLRQWENQIIMGCSLGIIHSAYDAAKNFAKTHKTGGKPIIAYQEVGFKLSEMLTLLQTAQLFTYRSVWTYEHQSEKSDALTNCAKVFVTEAAENVAGNALQILSGTGYLSGNAAERAFRCAKYGQIAGVSTEIARVKIGDDALGIRN